MAKNALLLSIVIASCTSTTSGELTLKCDHPADQFDLVRLGTTKLHASSTCGLKGKEEFLQYLYPGVPKNESRFQCDQEDNAHPVSYVGDGQEKTFWKSENNVQQVNLTVSFSQKFLVHFVDLKTGPTPLPEAFVLEKSSDYGNTYSTVFTYARTKRLCKSFFNMTAAPFAGAFGDTFCIAGSLTSGFDPVSNAQFIRGIVHPMHSNFIVQNRSYSLQWVETTNIRLRILDFQTLGSHHFPVSHGDKDLEKRFYYTIEDLRIYGTCSCNGMASTCKYCNTTQEWSCDCTGGTDGRDCSKCLPLFNNSPYFPGEACTECSCNNHATECQYNETLGFGVCKCENNTEGHSCERCAPGFYKNESVPISQPDACLNECPKCDATGSQSPACSWDGGDCECKPGVAGELCDRCEDPHSWNFPNCTSCNCFEKGSFNKSCDQETGQCHCRKAYHGQECALCLPGSHKLANGSCEICDNCIAQLLEPTSNMTVILDEYIVDLRAANVSEIQWNRLLKMKQKCSDANKTISTPGYLAKKKKHALMTVEALEKSLDPVKEATHKEEIGVEEAWVKAENRSSVLEAYYSQGLMIKRDMDTIIHRTTTVIHNLRIFEAAKKPSKEEEQRYFETANATYSHLEAQWEGTDNHYFDEDTPDIPRLGVNFYGRSAAVDHDEAILLREKVQKKVERALFRSEKLANLTRRMEVIQATLTDLKHNGTKAIADARNASSIFEDIMNKQNMTRKELDEKGSQIFGDLNEANSTLDEAEEILKKVFRDAIDASNKISSQEFVAQVRLLPSIKQEGFGALNSTIERARLIVAGMQENLTSSSQAVAGSLMRLKKAASRIDIAMALSGSSTELKDLFARVWDRIADAHEMLQSRRHAGWRDYWPGDTEMDETLSRAKLPDEETSSEVSSAEEEPEKMNVYRKLASFAQTLLEGTFKEYIKADSPVNLQEPTAVPGLSVDNVGTLIRVVRPIVTTTSLADVPVQFYFPGSTEANDEWFTDNEVDYDYDGNEVTFVTRTAPEPTWATTFGTPRPPLTMSTTEDPMETTMTQDDLLTLTDETIDTTLASFEATTNFGATETARSTTLRTVEIVTKAPAFYGARTTSIGSTPASPMISALMPTMTQEKSTKDTRTSVEGSSTDEPPTTTKGSWWSWNPFAGDEPSVMPKISNVFKRETEPASTLKENVRHIRKATLGSLRLSRNLLEAASNQSSAVKRTTGYLRSEPVRISELILETLKEAQAVNASLDDERDKIPRLNVGDSTKQLERAIVKVEANNKKVTGVVDRQNALFDEPSLQLQQLNRTREEFEWLMQIGLAEATNNFTRSRSRIQKRFKTLNKTRTAVKDLNESVINAVDTLKQKIQLARRELNRGQFPVALDGVKTDINATHAANDIFHIVRGHFLWRPAAPWTEGHLVTTKALRAKYSVLATRKYRRKGRQHRRVRHARAKPFDPVHRGFNGWKKTSDNFILEEVTISAARSVGVVQACVTSRKKDACTSARVRIEKRKKWLDVGFTWNGSLLTLKLADEIAEIDAEQHLEGGRREPPFTGDAYALSGVTIGEEGKRLGCLMDMSIGGRPLTKVVPEFKSCLESDGFVPTGPNVPLACFSPPLVIKPAEIGLEMLASNFSISFAFKASRQAGSHPILKLTLEPAQENDQMSSGVLGASFQPQGEELCLWSDESRMCKDALVQSATQVFKHFMLETSVPKDRITYTSSSNANIDFKLDDFPGKDQLVSSIVVGTEGSLFCIQNLTLNGRKAEFLPFVPRASKTSFVTFSESFASSAMCLQWKFSEPDVELLVGPITRRLLMEFFVQPNLWDLRATPSDLPIPIFELKCPARKFSMNYYVRPAQNGSLFLIEDKQLSSAMERRGITAPESEAISIDLVGYSAAWHAVTVEFGDFGGISVCVDLECRERERADRYLVPWGKIKSCQWNLNFGLSGGKYPREYEVHGVLGRADVPLDLGSQNEGRLFVRNLLIDERPVPLWDIPQARMCP